MSVDYNKFKFEFLLSVNKNIICQRLFDIRNYNEQILSSIDLKWLIDDCVDIIEDDLKEKTIEYLWKFYNPYVKQEQIEVDESRNNIDKEHTFEFEIRVNRKCVIKKQFDGRPYAPNVKYQVDITDIIGDLISVVRDAFSNKKLKNIETEISV